LHLTETFSNILDMQYAAEGTGWFSRYTYYTMGWTIRG